MNATLHVETTDFGTDAARDIAALRAAAADMNLSPTLIELLSELASAIESKKPFALFIDEQQFTPNQLAPILGVSRPHLVEKYIQTGLLESTKVGNHYRVSSSALDDFLRRRNAAHAVVAAALAKDPYSLPSLDLSDDELDAIDGI